MKKFIAILMAIAMLACFAACSGGTKSPVGVWNTELDMQKAIESAPETAGEEDSEEMLKMMGDAFKGISLKMILELKEDGKYEFSFDEASAKTAAEKMAAGLKEVFPAIMAAIAGTTEEAIAQSFAELGISMDDMMASFLEEFDPSTMMDDMEGVKGTWRYENGKLWLTPDGATENAEEYMTVELSGGKMTVTAVNGDETALESYKQLLPLVFTK